MPPTTVRERKRLEREARVLEAAMRLAAEGGYDAVQMREVAARADVAMGTVYRYFNSKDALLVAGLASWISLARRRARQRPVEVDVGPDRRLLAVLESTVGASVGQPLLMEALITASASTEPQVAEEKTRVAEELIGLMTDALGQGRGVDGLDVEGVCRVIAHVWFSAIVSWVGGVQPPDRVMDELRVAVRLLVPDQAD